MPKLFLIRHAIAEDRTLFQKTGLPDDQRPLTEVGRKKMKKISKKLYSLEPKIDLFCQSPLLRSQQTVDILREDFKKSKIKTIPSLAPESRPEDLLQSLSFLKTYSVAIVGHEDHLSQFLWYLLQGTASHPPFYFKKGGIACLSCRNFAIHDFELLWFVTPKILLS